jgi:hypothetical protein
VKIFFIWIGVVVGVLLAVILVATGIGMLLPVKHVAARTEAFVVSQQRLWDLAMAQFQKTNDGSYAIVEQSPPHRFVTAIVKKDLPFGGTWTYEFAPSGAGTALTITERGEVYNPFFRFVSRYVMGHTKSIDDFMAALRKAAEAKS